MTAPKTVLIGDRVRWTSAAGTLRGEVINIFPSKNANDDLIMWIMIEYIGPRGIPCHATLADTALEMMQFKVIFRDIEIQIARGEKVVA